MKEFIKLEDEVKQLLINFAAARNDDMFLYYAYCLVMCRKNGTILDDTLFIAMFTNKAVRAKYTIKTFGAVERARRKVQASCPELVSERVKALRAKKEEEYKEYSRL